MDAPNGGTISLSLRLAKALGLARVGKLRDAQVLIAGDRTIPDHPLELQALAALVTSEGDYLRALKLWELLLQREPGHAEARRMVDAIELWLARPSWMRYWPLLGATAVAVVVAGLFWALASGPAPAPVRTPATVESDVTYGSGVPPGTNAEFGEAPVSAPVGAERVQPAPRVTPAPSYESQPAPTVRFPGVSTPPKKRANSR